MGSKLFKGLIGAARSALPVAGAIAGGVIGGVAGGPGGAALGSSAGGALGKGASRIGVKKTSPGSPAAQSQVRELPQSASSLGEARSQDKARMKRSYNYDGGNS